MSEVSSEKQREFALQVLETLRGAGFEAFWAGGCVRDALLGLTPKDYDVATNARPEEVRRLFGRRRTLGVGESFGVIIVIGPARGGQVEVATFRHDGIYSDGRRPDSVTFGTAEEDVKRRDFTINGMLYDPLSDRLLDYVGGKADLKDGVLRAIGDPRHRFDEDKLRMLRAVRFAARFDFRLEEQTRAAIEEMADQATIVSAERIAQEMRAILVHPSRHTALELCRQTRLLDVLLPEVLPVCTLEPSDESNIQQSQSSDPSGDEISGVWAHTLEVLRQLRDPSFPLALAALLHETRPTAELPSDVEELARIAQGAETAKKVCRRWRLSNDEADRVIWLVRHHLDLRNARSMPWPKLQRMLITDGIEELLDLCEADALAAGATVDSIGYCRERLKKPPEELNPTDLITGHDLIRHGLPQGRIYKLALDRVRDAQLEGRIHDRAAALRLVDQLMAAGEIEPSPHVWID